MLLPALYNEELDRLEMVIFSRVGHRGSLVRVKARDSRVIRQRTSSLFWAASEPKALLMLQSVV